MRYSKIIAGKTAFELENKIDSYLRNGWKLVNCFFAAGTEYEYKAVLVK